MHLRWITTLSLIGICLLTAPEDARAQDTTVDQHLGVALRMVGHRILLRAGDSLSRVLPVVREDNRYRLAFGSDFSINPEDLADIVDSVMVHADITRTYILEVRPCDSDEVVYSFEMSDRINKDIVPCRSRDLPEDCYHLWLTFFEAPAELADKVITAADRPDEGNDRSMIIFSVLALIITIGVVVGWRRRRSAEDPDIIRLGQYHFDQKHAILIMKEQRTELTAKEADLLSLLYESGNDTVKREEILQRVWEDEGDYIGRTLDVYISKLRKKLEADPGVKIVNVRGVGYKLVIDG